MADSVDVILYGHPAIGEVRARAVFELKRLRRQLAGDVDVDVRLTVRNRRCLVPATHAAPMVEQVILAALQTQTIESRMAVRSVRYVRPVVDGLDVLVVSFRPSSDRLLLI